MNNFLFEPQIKEKEIKRGYCNNLGVSLI
jgi:hypothetical protein